MGKILDFEFYEKEKVCTRVHVDYKRQTVDVENFTDDVVAQAFGRRPISIETIDEFFRERVFPETRVDKDVLLSLLGLRCFDAEAIARKTHGMVIGDFNWVRFDNEDLEYEEIAKLRGWS